MGKSTIGIRYDEKNEMYYLRIGDSVYSIIPFELKNLSEITDGRKFLEQFRDWGNPISQVLLDNRRTAYDVMRKVERMNKKCIRRESLSDKLR